MQSTLFFKYFLKSVRCTSSTICMHRKKIEICIIIMSLLLKPHCRSCYVHVCMFWLRFPAVSLFLCWPSELIFHRHTHNWASFVWYPLPVSLYGICASGLCSCRCSVVPGPSCAPPCMFLVPSPRKSTRCVYIKGNCSSKCGELSVTTKELGFTCGVVRSHWAYCSVMWYT